MLAKECVRNRIIGATFVSILAVALILRFAGVGWGYPFSLHPDERTIVNTAINMVEKNSFTPTVFYRPDHLPIKINAAIYYIIRFFAPEKYADIVVSNKLVLHIVSRAITVLFSAGCMILAYFLGKKLKNRCVGLWSMFLVAFVPALLHHSLYVTPDTYTLFFMLLMVYWSLYYIEAPNCVNLIKVCLAVSLFFTTKYPGAILCIGIAINIIHCAIRDKKWKRIFFHGVLSIALCAAMVFLISPALFLQFNKVLGELAKEARSSHLGADGLGFFGNVTYYWRTIGKNMGLLTMLFAAFGLLWIVKGKKCSLIPLAYPLIYLLCISVLGLHWPRWALPMYPTFILLASLGFDYVRELAKTKYKKYAAVLLACVVCVNMLLSSVTVSAVHVVQDSRVASRSYADEHSITKKNAIYEGYTALQTNTPGRIFDYFVLQPDGTYVLQATDEDDEANDIEYILLSSSMYGRIKNESKKYHEEIAIYEYISSEYEEILRITPPKRNQILNDAGNIMSSMKYLLQLLDTPYGGSEIIIYRVSEIQSKKN